MILIENLLICKYRKSHRKIEFPSNLVLSEHKRDERVPKNHLPAIVEPTAFIHSFRLQENIPMMPRVELRYTVLDTARTERPEPRGQNRELRTEKSEPRPSNVSTEIQGSDMKGITERSI